MHLEKKYLHVVKLKSYAEIDTHWLQFKSRETKFFLNRILSYGSFNGS